MPSPAARAELEALPPELLERAQKKWEPGFRQVHDKRERVRGSMTMPGILALRSRCGFMHRFSPYLPFLQRQRDVAGSILCPDKDSGAKLGRANSDCPAGERRNDSKSSRAPRTPVTTPFLRPTTPRQVQDTDSSSATSRAPEAWPNQPSVVSSSEGVEAFAGLNNPEASPSPPVTRQAETDAGAFGKNYPDTGAAPAANGRPQRADPLELEMARLLGRETG
jgi:hypothetical protein